MTTTSLAVAQIDESERLRKLAEAKRASFKDVEHRTQNGSAPSPTPAAAAAPALAAPKPPAPLPPPGEDGKYVPGKHTLSAEQLRPLKAEHGIDPVLKEVRVAGCVWGGNCHCWENGAAGSVGWW
jgi:hypothetical protein